MFLNFCRARLTNVKMEVLLKCNVFETAAVRFYGFRVF